MKNMILVLLISVFAVSCTTREEVEADIWLNDKLPARICGPEGELWNYGVYRKVECKYKPEHKYCQNGEKYFQEFIPYCSNRMKSFLSMDKVDANRWLEKLTRPKAEERAEQ